VGLFVDLFKCDRAMIFLKQFENIEAFGKDGYDVEALDLGFRQGSLRTAVSIVKQPTTA
jgi:hypothetical protein